jgi:hypothetical protein
MASASALPARVSSLVATPVADGRRAGAARAPVAAVPAAQRVVRCAAGTNPGKGQPVQAAFGAAATAKAVRHTTSTKAVATEADGAPRPLSPSHLAISMRHPAGRSLVTSRTAS